MTGPTPEGTFPELSTRVRQVVLLLATACSFAASVAFLGRKGFWLDELYSAAFVGGDWSSFWHLVRNREANMSLYYLLLKGWMTLGASSDAFLRFPSVLFATACVPALYTLGRRLIGNTPALIAAVMLALHGFLLLHARQVRGYSFLLLLVILSGIAFLRMIEGGYRRRDLAAFALLGALAAWAHFFALLATAAMGLSLLFRPRGSVLAVRVLAAFAGWGLAVLPLLLFIVTRDKGQVGWIPSPFPGEILGYGKHLCGRTVILVPPFALLAAAGAIALRDRLRARGIAHSPEVVLLVLWLLLPPATAIALSVVKPIFIKRYLIGTLPPFLLLCGLGLSTLKPRRLALLAAAWILAGQLVMLPDGWNSPREDWRSIVRAVRAEARPGDGIVSPGIPHASPMAFDRYGAIPMDGLPPAPPLVLPQGFDLRRFTDDGIGNPKAAGTLAAASSCRRIWVVFNAGKDPEEETLRPFDAIGRRVFERRFEMFKVVLLDRR